MGKGSIFLEVVVSERSQVRPQGKAGSDIYNKLDQIFTYLFGRP